MGRGDSRPRPASAAIFWRRAGGDVARFPAVHRMSFRLFGVEVEVQVSFWITASSSGSSKGPEPGLSRGAAVAIWVAVVFVSVLLHELGHAFALRRHGIAPTVTLYGLGGLTDHRSAIPLRRRDSVVVSLAGPFAGFLVGGVILAAAALPPGVRRTCRRPGPSPWSRCSGSTSAGASSTCCRCCRSTAATCSSRRSGPRRRQLTAAVSTLVGVRGGGRLPLAEALLGGLIFGLAAVQSYRRFAARRRRGEAEPPPPDGPHVPPEPRRPPPGGPAALATRTWTGPPPSPTTCSRRAAPPPAPAARRSR